MQWLQPKSSFSIYFQLTAGSHFVPTVELQALKKSACSHRMRLLAAPSVLPVRGSMTANKMTTPTQQADNRASAPRAMVVAALVAVLFFFGLLIFERIPEIPVDIDFKPFFIPFMFLALLPKGLPTLAIPLGAAVGESIGDIIEGYEVDDVFGFFGYFVGFAIAGLIINGRPLKWGRVAMACIVGALVQAVIEASAFMLFGEEGLSVALFSALGNTITHGIILGAIITIPLVRALHGRLERLLGYTPHRPQEASNQQSVSRPMPSKSEAK